jgi:glutamine synthetase
MKLSKEQILAEVKKSPNKKVKVAVTDIDGVLRGKYIHHEKFQSIVESGFGFCDVVFGWDSSDQGYDNSDFTGWHSGFPDAQAQVDVDTYRTVPWDNEVPFFLADFVSGDGGPHSICPRQLLKKTKKLANEMGYSASFGQEFEFFNFRENSDDINQREFHQPQHLTQGMFGYSILRMSQNKEFFNDIYDSLYKFRVPLEGLHTETGPGVFEAAILYDDVLESADRAILFKSSVKELGHKYGIMPTFMAKISDKLPGCSGHLHQSLWKDGKNVFHDANRPHGMSEIMEQYLAGLLHCLPHVLSFYAPTVNSYKRLVEGAWAPTTVTWGIDNRTVAIRALPGSSKSTRLEMRVVGSDANPYLAHAASLASGLYGIKHKLKLPIAQTKGNGYREEKAIKLPGSLWDATQMTKNSEVAKELFGETFVKHFTQSREWEWKQFSKVVTDWEFKRYFEII